MFLNDLLRIVSYPDSYRDAQTRQPKADSNSARLPPRQGVETLTYLAGARFETKARLFPPLAELGLTSPQFTSPYPDSYRDPLLKREGLSSTCC